MSQLALAFKQEIVRIARREMRSQQTTLKKATAQHRHHIALLRRQIDALEKGLSRLMRANGKQANRTESTPQSTIRFSAQRLKSLRSRLGISATAMSRLLGVSGQSVYNWERGITKPRRSQLAAIAELRTMGKRKVAAALEERSG